MDQRLAERSDVDAIDQQVEQQCTDRELDEKGDRPARSGCSAAA